MSNFWLSRKVQLRQKNAPLFSVCPPIRRHAWRKCRVCRYSLLPWRVGIGRHQLLLCFSKFGRDSGPAVRIPKRLSGHPDPKAGAIVVLLQKFFQIARLVTIKTNFENKYIPNTHLHGGYCGKKPKINYKVESKTPDPVMVTLATRRRCLERRPDGTKGHRFASINCNAGICIGAAATAICHCSGI